MEELDRLEERRERILLEIRGIRSMRKGSVVEQYLKGARKGQPDPAIRGPYFLYTRKEKGKTVGKRLKKSEVNHYRREVESFHRFQGLCDEYARITEQLGDLERAIRAETQEKKQPRLPSKRKRR